MEGKERKEKNDRRDEERKAREKGRTEGSEEQLGVRGREGP